MRKKLPLIFLVIILGLWAMGYSQLSPDIFFETPKKVYGDALDRGLVIERSEGKDAVFIIAFTGEETGYLEPCGCSEDQLGGIPRRHSFLRVRSQESGVGSQRLKTPDTGLQTPDSRPIPVSLGDLTNGFGRQSEIKMEIAVQALETMGYLLHNLGERDIALGSELLNNLSVVSRLKFLSSNVKFTNPLNNKIHSFLIKHVKAGETSLPHIKVGFVGILSPDLSAMVPSSGFKIIEPIASLRPLISVLKDRVDVLVLLSHAEMNESIRLAKAFPELDLVISGHGIDEPTAYEPVYIQNTPVVSTGNKGKYVGVYKYFPYNEKKGEVGLIPLSSNYADSLEMRELMKRYLQRVKDENLLAYEPRMPIPSGNTFVGSKTCGICHKEVHKHWETTTHAFSYETLVKSEHQYDPDCVPCHVTGFRYTSGFESVEKTPALKGVGCEECHGPGSAHINTPMEEYGETTTNNICTNCHIPDHSPKFEFTSYWKEITHPKERVSGLGG